MTMLRKIADKPWLWSFVAAFATWLATIAFTGGQGGEELLTAAFTFATFFVIVGIGQMFVITLGPGNVDLSIPATITLAATPGSESASGGPPEMYTKFCASIVYGQRIKKKGADPSPPRKRN